MTTKDYFLFCPIWTIWVIWANCAILANLVLNTISAFFIYLEYFDLLDHYGNLGHFYPSGYFVSSDNFGNLCHFVHFWPSKTKLDFGSHSKFYPFLSLGKWIIKEGRIVPTTFWSSLISKNYVIFYTVRYKLFSYWRWLYHEMCIKIVHGVEFKYNAKSIGYISKLWNPSPRISRDHKNERLFVQSFFSFRVII